MTLELNGLAVDCVIGDLPEERLRSQRLKVDVALELAADAATTDALADTVDYAALADRIRAALIAARCRMIERAAAVVRDVCLGDSKVRSVRVRVEKPSVVPGLDSAAVVL